MPNMEKTAQIYGDGGQGIYFPLKPASGPVTRDASKQANRYFSKFPMHLKAAVKNEDDIPLDSVDRHGIKPGNHLLLSYF